MVAPVIREPAGYAGKVLYGKLDVDKKQETSMQYEIIGVLTLLVSKNGKRTGSPAQCLDKS
jgi:hypothetical protein